VLLGDECPVGFLRLGPSLGAPGSAESDPPKKCGGRNVVLASALVANETNHQPCPNKALAGGQAAAGEVSLLCFVPLFENHHFIKKKPSSRQSSFCLSALYNSEKRTGLLCKAAAPLASRLFQAPSSAGAAALQGGSRSGVACVK